MIISACHNWPEPPGFTTDQPSGSDNYTFLHFFTSVELMIDGINHILLPDACIIYSPQTPQWFHSDKKLLYDWMHLSTDVSALLERYNLPVNQIFYPANTSFITASIYKIELEFYGDQAHRRDLANSELQQMLIYLSRMPSKSVAASSFSAEQSAVLSRLRLRLMLYKHEQWTLQRMADETNMSVSRFCAVYKARFGMSPMNDLICMRIDAAKKLLIGSELTISDVASQLGYANVTHFNRQFKKSTGVSPTAYAEANASTLSEK